MNIITRTCANCAAFNAAPPIDQPTCGNLVSFIVSPDHSRDPGPTDTCDDHQTSQEDAYQSAYFDANRTRIMGTVKAMVATEEPMDKLRKRAL